jgi:CHAT domain-containing protein
VVGNPTMPREVEEPDGTREQLASLPAAEQEADSVARLLGAAVLVGSQATESAVRVRLAGAPLVHLATHGQVYAGEAQVRSSWVALAPDSLYPNGLLTLGEWVDEPGLGLRAELVVLSACQTGLGDLKQAEGTVGFQRALLARGARSVLVSLWSVNDAATAALMEAFYRHWLEDRGGVSKAEALRRAEWDVRGTPGWTEPRYWAAFQLVGAR